MANKDSKNFVDTIVEAQKQMVDTVTEQSKKFANGNNAMKETVEKGSEWYKNWLEGQNNIFSTAKEKAATMTDKTQAGTDKMNEYYQNWMSSQMEMAKNMWDMNMNQMKNNTPNMATNNDPMSMWNNMMTNWNNWSSNMNQAAQWKDMMNKFQSANPFTNNTNPFSADAFKKVSEDWTGMFNQYYEMLNSSFANMQKDIQNGTTQDAFRNMVNVSEAFTRFSEMWTPFMKSIQDKTFNTEMFKEYANPAMYKDMMDKYFGFMPEQNREYMQNMTNMMQENFAKMNQGNMAGYNQMRDMMGNMMPNQSDIFGTMLNNHNSFTKMMSDASAPFMKMMGSDKNTKSIAEWSDIANRMAVYNIKNSEMQYMVYNQGTKVMNNLADYIAKKVESGEEITSMMTVYQEWLNIGDKTFVELFESEDYSKMMAEVNAMQLTLRKDVEKQLEKAMTGIPVATRSEMDEIYKTIYDLKKQVRELEKVTVENIANETPVEKTTATKTTAAKSTTASRAKK